MGIKMLMKREREMPGALIQRKMQDAATPALSFQQGALMHTTADPVQSRNLEFSSAASPLSAEPRTLHSKLRMVGEDRLEWTCECKEKNRKNSDLRVWPKSSTKIRHIVCLDEYAF